MSSGPRVWRAGLTGPWGDAVRSRLPARIGMLAATSVVVALFVLFGGLGLPLALAGLAALLVWAAFWPAPARRPDEPEIPLGTRREREAASRPASWQLVLDGLPDAALVLDGDAAILAFNASASEILGVRQGRHLSQFVRVPELLAAVEAALRAGKV